jgi:ADP-dependent NAD(P)H-hydrate dehydratase / NAD(P)H-hydrate epimerase
MKIVTAEQMRSLDRAAIERHGIPSLVLMERAGEGLARAVRAHAGEAGAEIVIVAGPGNNGGDGLVAARHLLQQGIPVFVILLAAPAKLSPDARANYDRLLAEKAPVQPVLEAFELEAQTERLARAACIVDAIFGTGLLRDIAGLAAKAIDLINASGRPVIAADVPSGLDANTGTPKGTAVRADATATFGLPKRGLFVGAGPAHAGRIEMIDIGIPAEEVARVDSKLALIDPSMFASCLGARAPSSHKGDFGHVLIFAGASGHLGAGYLASLAALRAGCGLVSYALPASAFDRFDARYPEVMCDPIADGGAGHFAEMGLADALRAANGKDAVAIGPAIGTAAETRSFVNALLRDLAMPAVVDADALNVLDIKALSRRAAPTILTPHPGEMSRLLHLPTADIQADRLGSARTLAAQSGAIVVLKGQGTVIADPAGDAAINPTGNPGMASAGMGDALTGIVASLLAQGLEPRTAAMAAVYLHGLAGDLVAAERGEASLIASDVIGKLGKAIERVRSERT